MPAEQQPAGNAAPDPNATTTTQAAAAQPAPQPEKKAGGNKSLMDTLGIPEEIQKQITPNDVKPQEAVTSQGADDDQDQQQAGDDQQQDQQGGDDAGGNADDALAGDDADADESEQQDGQQADDDQDQDQQVQGKKPSKTQKRINRLTRQKQEAQDRADALAAENQQWRDYYAAQQKQGPEAQQLAAPIGAGRLSHVQNEAQLNYAVSEANAIIDHVDKLIAENPEGMYVGEGDKREFKSVEELRSWRNEAEKRLLNAPLRLDQIRGHRAVRQQFDDAARADFPELFDKSTPEFQNAVAIVREFPALAQLPGANYYLGLVIEGKKALQARAATNGHNQNGNGNGATKRAIDARAFAPRVPLAPSAPNPPSRTPNTSSQKKVDTAMQELAADPDGGAEALAKVFAAESAAKSRSTTGSRVPVTV